MAGGKATTFDSDLLKLIFNGTPIAQLADNAATAPLTFLYLSLHTADPGIGGLQSTQEATYGGYTRIPVPRDASGFVITGNMCVLANPEAFPIATSGDGQNELFFAVGTAPTGTGKILYRGPLTPVVTIVTGQAPTLTTATTITEN